MAGKQFQILAVLVALFLVQAGLVAIGGGLYFTSHEADMVHLTDLVLRQSAGAVYHVDLASPLGEWATAPMALLHRAGLGLGTSMVWGQMIALAVLFPALAVVAANRLTQGQALVFGLVVTGLVSGLVFGGTDPLVSLSMHYNRWCWAATLIVALMVVLPGAAPNSPVEGAILGGLMAAMAMVKVSYPVALAFPVVFGLLRNGRIRVFFASIVAASAVLLAVTFFRGIGYWEAYLGDLTTVAGSANRAAPGSDWRALVLSPTGVPATLAVLSAIYFSARTERRDLGAILLFFFAAFTFITWQNYGNDPVWLCVLALTCWVLSTQGQGSARRALRVTSVAAGVLILPVMLNILWSPLRHLASPGELSRPLLAAEPDLRMVAARAGTAFARTVLIAPPDHPVTTFRQESLPDCELSGGLIAALERDAAALLALAPGIDRQPLVADLFQAQWLFAGLRPLEGGTPWYYDGLPGLADATHVMIPDCPADLRARARVIELLEGQGVALEEAGRAEGFHLYRIVR